MAATGGCFRLEKIDLLIDNPRRFNAAKSIHFHNIRIDGAQAFAFICNTTIRIKNKKN
jgi:hypothetical protein